jgi:hypothetical protein
MTDEARTARGGHREHAARPRQSFKIASQVTLPGRAGQPAIDLAFITRR